MANTELIVQFIEKGSDSLGTFQAIISAIASQSDSLSIILKKNYCKYLGGKNNVAPENLPSWMTYCENT